MKRLRCARPNRALLWNYNGSLYEKDVYRATDSLDTVHAHCLDRPIDRPCIKSNRQDSQRETTPRIITNSLAKRGVVERTHCTFINSGEKPIRNFIPSNCMTVPGTQIKHRVPFLQLELEKHDPPLFSSSVPLP